MDKILPTGRCPKCGGMIPAESAHGLCPKCLLAGASTPTDPGIERSGTGASPGLDEIAAAFPELEVLDVLGQGGMGVVFKARQPRLDRLVALKILLPHLGATPDFAERFLREARMLARLNHPNIVTVHDFGESGGFYYLLMEYVDGVNLRQAMRTGRFAPEQALAVVPKICEALQYAHDEGVLHRDIKPENILIDTRGRVKIADFGIAKLIGSGAEFTLTQSGARLGTPTYMAPEQIENRGDVDHRADIYSLGVVFYEMLTGELPIGRFAPPSSKSAVDARIDEIVFRTLEKEREQRFQSAGEVKTRVETVAAHPQAPAPKLAVDSTPATSGKWSLKAVWGAVLVALSLPTFVGPALLLVVPFVSYRAGPAESVRTVGPGIMLLALVGFFPAVMALVGTILGWMGMRDVRESRGTLRGGGLSVFAAVTWPLLIGAWVCALAVALAARAFPRGDFLLPNAPIWIGALVLAAVLFLAITSVRKAWRWTMAPAATGEAAPPHRRRGRVWLWLLVPAFILLAPCVGLLLPYFAARTTPQPTMQLIVRAVGVEDRDDEKFLTMDFTTRFSRGRRVEAGSKFVDHPSEVSAHTPRVNSRGEAESTVIGTILENGRTVDVRRVAWRLPDGRPAEIEAACAKSLAQWVNSSTDLAEGREIPVFSMPMSETETFTAYLTVPARQSGRPVPTIHHE